MTVDISDNSSINILVVYHSQTGHTKKMAEAVAKGAGSVKNVRVGKGQAKKNIKETMGDFFPHPLEFIRGRFFPRSLPLIKVSKVSRWLW